MPQHRITPVRARLLALLLFVSLVAVTTVIAALGLRPTGVGVLVPALAAVGLWVGLFVQARRQGSHHGLLAAGVLWVLQLGLGVGALRIATLACTLDPGGLAARSWLAIPGLLLLGLGLAGIWTALERRGLEPSPAAKTSLGFVALALACTCLATGIEWARGGGAVASVATITCGIALSFAHALSGPDCVRKLFDALPPHTRAAGLASCLLTLACVQSLAASLSSPRSPDMAFVVCLTLGFAALAAAVLGSFIWGPMLVLEHTRPHDDGPSDALVGRPARSLDVAL
jgi:hypothetical protein